MPFFRLSNAADGKEGSLNAPLQLGPGYDTRSTYGQGRMGWAFARHL
jgi:hypothetical protein